MQTVCSLSLSCYVLVRGTHIIGRWFGWFLLYDRKHFQSSQHCKKTLLTVNGGICVFLQQKTQQHLDMCGRNIQVTKATCSIKKICVLISLKTKWQCLCYAKIIYYPLSTNAIAVTLKCQTSCPQCIREDVTNQLSHSVCLFTCWFVLFVPQSSFLINATLSSVLCCSVLYLYPVCSPQWSGKFKVSSNLIWSLALVC